MGMKLPPESMTQGIGGAFSSGCILVGAAIVPAPGISCLSTCPVPAACSSYFTLLHMLGVVPLRRVVGEMGVAFEGFWGHCLCRMEASEGKNK